MEDKLTEWFLGKGLNNSSGVREYGLKLLFKLGGEGYTKVINRGLNSPNPWIRQGSLPIAVRRPDEETIAALIWLTRLHEESQLAPSERSDATVALRSLGRWPEVIESVVRWGKRFDLEPERSLAGWQLDDTDMSPAIEALTSLNDPSPGAIFALAIGGRSDRLSTVRAILDQALPCSEIATACIVAIGLLKDESRNAIELLKYRLSIEKERHVARVALMRIGTETAMASLLSHISTDFDTGTAAHLLGQPCTETATTTLIQIRLINAGLPERLSLIQELAPIVDSITYGKLLDNPELQEFLREVAFDSRVAHSVEAQEAAIRGLAQFDADAAFVAAYKALLILPDAVANAFPISWSRLIRAKPCGTCLSTRSGSLRQPFLGRSVAPWQEWTQALSLPTG